MARAKTRGCGGRGGCGSDDQVALAARKRRCKMQETAEIPHPTTRNQEQGEEKTRQGEPHQPRRKKKAPLGQERKQRQSSNPTDQDQGQKTPTKTTDTDKTRNEKTPNRKRATTTKKKKTGAGQCLGEGEEEDVRIEGGERVQDEETQGEPQTKKVWGSPAPERERERERERNVADETNQTEEEDGRKQTPNTGRVVKGSKEQEQNADP